MKKFKEYMGDMASLLCFCVSHPVKTKNLVIGLSILLFSAQSDNRS